MRRESRGALLARLFNEVGEHWNRSLATTATVTDEKTLRELILPPTAKSRLCFFSLPADLVSVYKQYVFPTVEAEGFAPTVAQDIIAPGANVIAVLESLIERCSVFVADLTLNAQSVVAELGIALSRRPAPPAIIAFARSPTGLAPQLADNPHITLLLKKEEFFDEQLLVEFSQSLAMIASGMRQTLEKEPLRLLEMGEYRSAVISAFSLLESEFRMRRRGEVIQRPPLFSKEIESMLPEASLVRFRRWRMIRNRAVHSLDPVSASAAREIVHGVLELAKALRKGGRAH